MSESSGPQSTNVMSEGRWRVGSVGPVIKDVKLKIDKQDQNGDGEVKNFNVNKKANMYHVHAMGTDCTTCSVFVSAVCLPVWASGSRAQYILDR